MSEDFLASVISLSITGGICPAEQVATIQPPHPKNAEVTKRAISVKTVIQDMVGGLRS